LFVDDVYFGFRYGLRIGELSTGRSRKLDRASSPISMIKITTAQQMTKLLML
jgi:hypothetical protein